MTHWDVDHPLTLEEAGERLARAVTWFEGARCSEETRLSFGYIGDSFNVAFHGGPEPALLSGALTLVASAGIAPHVWRLRLTGAREGLPGDLTPLGRGAVFGQLEVLDIELAGGSGEEGLAHALGRMPRLRRLSVAAAPGAAFFEGEPHPLRELVLQCGDTPGDFIEQLAHTRRFPRLEALDFTDCAERGTSHAAFEALFASRSLPALREVVLRGTVLDAGDAQRLRTTALGRQLSRLEVME
jgi:hypothetical protein